MNDLEKQELAESLAKLLEPFPCSVDSPLGFWTAKHDLGSHNWEPKILDGNFAAAVIAAMRRQSSKVWFYFHAEVSKGLSDVGTEFPMVVCLAAKAALEGATE